MCIFHSDHKDSIDTPWEDLRTAVHKLILYLFLCFFKDNSRIRNINPESRRTLQTYTTRTHKTPRHTTAMRRGDGLIHWAKRHSPIVQYDDYR